MCKAHFLWRIALYKHYLLLYWNQVVCLCVIPLSGRPFEPLNCMQPNFVSMMVHHHDLECHAKRFGSYLQGQGHGAGSNPPKK